MYVCVCVGVFGWVWGRRWAYVGVGGRIRVYVGGCGCIWVWVGVYKWVWGRGWAWVSLSSLIYTKVSNFGQKYI